MLCSLFASYIFLFLFGVPMVEPISMLLYWPPPSALVAYTDGTNVGHGPVKTPFLTLILFLVPMTPCDTILYWLSSN